ncbi:transposase, partial [Klebsiella oxytoca]
VTAKLKGKTSLTDVPFAVTEAELLSELGWNLWDNEQDVNEGLFSESVMRKLLSKYTGDEWVSFYNKYVQEHLVKKL